MFGVFAYPGLMTLDSVDQLAEARAGFFTDAHPPAMAAIWALLDRLVAGPLLVLVLQVSSFLAGSYLVLRRAMSPRAAALAAVLVLLLPPVANPMAFVWKDSLMAGLCMLGAGLVLSADRRARLASLACFTLATAVKYNALAATLPLIVLCWQWRAGLPWPRRYALATAAWLAVTGAAMGANALLTDQPMYPWHSSLALADIAGVIANEGELPDEQLVAELAGTGLVLEDGIQRRAREIYASRDMMTLLIGERRIWDIAWGGRDPAPAAQRAAVERAWQRLVFGHPGAYLRSRIDMLLDVLGVTYTTHSAVPPRIMKHPGFLTRLGLSTRSWWLQNRWSAAHKWLWRHTPLFRPWLYVVLGALLLAALPWLARGHRDGRRGDVRDVVALLASGLVAELSLLPLAVSPDYRYSHWTIACVVLAIVLITSRRVAAARGTADTPAASPRA